GRIGRLRLQGGRGGERVGRRGRGGRGLLLGHVRSRRGEIIEDLGGERRRRRLAPSRPRGRLQRRQVAPRDLPARGSPPVAGLVGFVVDLVGRGPLTQGRAGGTPGRGRSLRRDRREVGGLL